MSRAVVLFSGGLDSTTTLAEAMALGHTVFALTVDYGQRHRFEIEAARRIAARMQVAEHKIVGVDLRCFGGSALTEAIEVPKDRLDEPVAEAIPVTYVPARNTVFLSLALAYAEVIGAESIFFGANAIDYSGYPDCRPQYIEAFAKMANLATKAAVESAQHYTICAPLLRMTKAEIIRRGMQLGVDYGLTHSCYDPDPSGVACGGCDACLLRIKGFAEAGLADPIAYMKRSCESRKSTDPSRAKVS